MADELPLIGIRVETTNRGLNRVTKKLEQATLFRLARESLQETLTELQRLVVKRVPVNTGRTAENIFTQVEGYTLADLNGIVASPDTHFIVLEYGREPGKPMPPHQPIAEWAADKGIEASAVFPIRRAIGMRGLPALHIMRNAMEEGRGHFAVVWFRRFLAEWGSR